MKVAGIYSFNDGERVVRENYEQELAQVCQIISDVDAHKHRNKKSKEIKFPGKMLYSPRGLNNAFKRGFKELAWEPYRVQCEYPTEFYVPGYDPPHLNHGAFREMDFVKNRVGIEIQFGKYAFMVYNVAAKMTIFHNLDVIDVGIEIVPMKDLQVNMSSGVSYFEQFVWDLEHRGPADIDIPVLILGITLD